MKFPPDFTRRMQDQLGPEWEAFAQAHQEEAPVSLRVHPLKWRNELSNELPLQKKVPWCPRGYYLSRRPHFPSEILWHAGAYYVQEASSMLLCHLLSQIKLPQNALVLDLGAAPGGKSTLLLDHLPKGSILLANEPIKNRLPALRENLRRWGYAHALVSQHQAREITEAGLSFDLILVDAPCSGEGLFRKQPEAMKAWSKRQADLCALRQTKILQHILPALKTGGYLIYSTCTYHSEENEKQVENLREAGLCEIRPDIPADWQVKTLRNGYQCYPHKLAGEGFYFALLQKETEGEKPRSRKTIHKPAASDWKAAGQEVRLQLSEQLPAIREWPLLESPRHGLFALPPESAEQALQLLSRLRRCRPIAEVFRRKGKLLRPAPAAALQIGWQKGVALHELSTEEALGCLQGHPPANPEEKRGHLLLTYRQLPLRWAKGVRGRLNLL